jgi:hypothetical protein
MEYNRNDIQAHIDRANKMRSEAMGKLLFSGWAKCSQILKSMTHFPTHTSAFIRRA